MDKATCDALLQDLRGASFIGIDTVTEPKLKGGKKCPLGKVEKHTKGNRVMIFSKGGEDGGYANMVRRRLDNEPGMSGESFDLSPRAWGTRIEGTPYVEHKGAYYLEVIFMKAGEVRYTEDGKPVNKADIAEWLPTESVNEEGQGGLNGTDNRVIIRTFKLDSIVGMRAFGQEA